MKRLCLRLVVLATVAAALAGVGASSALADDSSCPANNACFWTGSDFTGVKKVIGAGDAGRWQGFDHPRFSMKNRFSARAVYYYAAFTGQYYCRYSNEEHHFIPAGADAYFVNDNNRPCWQ